jgi:hypothetical protein
MAIFEVTCRIENTPAMVHEAVNAEVKITNRSGRILQVEPGGPTRLRFIVERKPGYPLDIRKDARAYEPFEVAPGETRALSVNLKRYCDLVGTGPYTIRAMLQHQGRYYSSARVFLDIVPGFEIESLSAAAPEGGVRKYILKSMARGRGQSLFIEIDDPVRNLCYGVFDLGRTLSTHPPQIETDRSGNVHVLHQSGPSRYTHSAFSANGRPLEHRYFTKGAGIPQLRTSAEGAMEVTGVIEYEGDAHASRPVIRPFNPFE